ncbi:MAG: hypothetical protein ABIM73_06545 [Arenimonas sp.]
MINRSDSQEVTRGILSIVLIALISWVMRNLFNIQIPDANRDAVMLVLGALLLRLSDVYAYHFNTTAGSHAKDATISKMVDTVQEVAKLPPSPESPGKVELQPGDEVTVEATKGDTTP